MKHLYKLPIFLAMIYTSTFTLYAEPENNAPHKEIKSIEEIEPGFVSKDPRVFEIINLQNSVAAKEKTIEAIQEQKKKTRELLSLKIHEDLQKLTVKKTDKLNARLDYLVDQVVKHYEVALHDFPNEHRFSAHALYNLGRYYFDKDEKEYFDKLARYSAAKEEGREDILYPEEDFHRTIETYETLLKKHPNFPHMVDVYYLLGLALWYEGAFYNAVDKFEELIKKFPNNRLVEEVWFRLGEFFYDINDYEKAIRAYSKVTANTSSLFYDQATYKTAWAYFQLDHFMLSIENFEKLVERSYSEGNNGVAHGMRAEAIRYIIKNFSEQLLSNETKKIHIKKVGKEEKEYAEKLGVKLVKRIDDYFKSQGNPPYLREILLEAASQLLDESKIDGAVLAFEKIIELDPNNANNPRIDSQIIAILEEANRLDEANERNYALLKKYSKDSAWYRAQKGNREALKHAREAIRDAMLSLAVSYHKKGKELKEVNETILANKNFSKAAELYAEYIKEFPEREDTNKAIFYFAESAYEMGNYREALEGYKLLKNYPLPMPENFRRDATFNIVYTFRHVLLEESKEKRFKEIDFDNLTPKFRGAKPEQIPEIGHDYLSSINDFLKIAPNDEQAPILLFHAAAIYYAYGQLDEAFSKFFYIIDSYPKSRAASASARLLINDAIAEKDWQRVIELSKQFKAKEIGERSDFARLESNARFKIAKGIFDEAVSLEQNNQLSEARAKYKESAELFSNLLNDDPTSPYADVMLFNSARAIAQAGTLTKALPLYKRLYTEYPKSKYAKMARFQEALALEKMLEFTKAAKAYDAIIAQDPKSKNAADAMLNKALLYEAAGDMAKAAMAFLDFAKKYPYREEAADSLLTAAGLYKKMGKTQSQIAMLEQFIKHYRHDKQKIPAVIEAHVQIADTYRELEKTTSSVALKKSYSKASIENYRAAVNLYHPNLGSPIAAYFAAKARLILEKPEQEAFKKMSILGKLGKIQAEQMTAMMKKLTELSAKNEAIIKEYAQPVWNAESLRRIGVLYEHLARVMLKAPCPKDVASIDEFACDEYLILLEDRAAVLEEKALSAYKQAYEIALSSYDTPSDLIDDILAGLNRLRPGEYLRLGQLIEKPVTYVIEGEGRMLSTGKMASSLHAKEIDPDKKPQTEEKQSEEADEETKAINPSEKDEESQKKGSL